MKHQAATIDARRRRTPVRRQGVVYVAVLGAALIMTMIGLASLHVARVELRATDAASQSITAQNAAASAVELALTRIRSDANWRTTYTSGQEVPSGSWTTWGSSGKLKFVLVDDDGNLNDNDKDPVTIRGIGGSGDAVAAASVIVEPSGAALTCLETSLQSGDDVSVLGGTTTTDQFISSNDDVWVFVLRVLDGDVWARDNVTGTVTGNKFDGTGVSHEMPDTAHLFKYYIANGTPIAFSSIPNGRIEKVVLSAENNPYGATNPLGIYVIDCGNQPLTIADVRMQATLVLLNCGTPAIDNKINWTAPAPNLPLLLVQGSLEMKWDGGSALSESALSTNFNPPAAPLLGPPDSDTSDSYPGIIKGLIYVSGNLWINDVCVVQGPVVVGGATTMTATASLTYDGTPYNFPPPGFSKGTLMRIVPGTWKRTTR